MGDLGRARVRRAGEVGERDVISDAVQPAVHHRGGGDVGHRQRLQLIGGDGDARFGVGQGDLVAAVFGGLEVVRVVLGQIGEQAGDVFFLGGGIGDARAVAPDAEHTADGRDAAGRIGQHGGAGGFLGAGLRTAPGYNSRSCCPKRSTSCRWC